MHGMRNCMRNAHVRFAITCVLDRYLCRLGLWGAGTPFASFAAFREELRPLHLKARGCLVSRLISYDGVRVRVATHHLSPEQSATYDAATSIWQQLALVLRRRADTLAPSAASRFWSAHQRFFRCLVTASKLPTLHALLAEGLADGKSVVVGLAGTGEAYCGADDKDGLKDGAKETGGKSSPATASRGEVDLAPCDIGVGMASGLPSAPSAILKSVLVSVARCEPLKPSQNWPANPLFASSGVWHCPPLRGSPTRLSAATTGTLRSRLRLGRAAALAHGR